MTSSTVPAPAAPEPILIRKLKLPDSSGPTGPDGLAEAPSATRNLAPILDVLLPRLPRTGTVLELASGTGQHVAALAEVRPGLLFRPTDPDPDRRAVTDRRCADRPNVAAAAHLDAGRRGWAEGEAVDAVLVVNLLHLISDAEMAVLLDEAARALLPDGVLAIYGPFLRGGVAVSAGDVAFEASLRAQDPAIGYKDADVVAAVMGALAMTVERVEMPASNLMLLARKGMSGL